MSVKFKTNAEKMVMDVKEEIAEVEELGKERSVEVDTDPVFAEAFEEFADALDDIDLEAPDVNLDAYNVRKTSWETE